MQSFADLSISVSNNKLFWSMIRGNICKRRLFLRSLGHQIEAWCETFQGPLQRARHLHLGIKKAKVGPQRRPLSGIGRVSFSILCSRTHTGREGANQDKVGGQNRTNLEKLKMYLGWEKMVPLLLHNNNFTSLSSETQKRQIMTTCVHECQISVHSKPTSKYKWW